MYFLQKIAENNYQLDERSNGCFYAAPQMRHLQQPDTVVFSQNNKVSVDLNLGSVLEELVLRLRYAPTLTNTNNTQAKTLRGDEWAIVKGIRLVANGTDVLRDFSGDELWWINFFTYHLMPQVSPNLGDGTTANPVIDSILVLPTVLPGIKRPFDVVLPTGKLSSLKLEIEWGASTDLNADAAAFTTSPTMEIYSLQSFGIANLQPGQMRIYSTQSTITATTPRHQVKLPVGVTYRGLLIQTLDAGVEQGDILNNLKLRSGGNVFYDLPGKVIQEHVAQRLRLPRGFSGTAYDDHKISVQSSFNGWYFIDLAPGGSLMQVIDATGLSELFIEADVTVGSGTTLMNILPFEFIPLRGNPNA